MRRSNRSIPIPGFAIVCLLASGAQAPLSASDDPETVVDHSAIQEVLAMAEAGVDEEVILLRLEAIPEVPELNGQAIAALKKKGLSRSVLLRLVERSQELERSHEPLPAQPAPTVADEEAQRPAPAVVIRETQRPVPAVAQVEDQRPAADEEDQESAPRIRIEVQAKFPIHYAEVLIGDRRVATQGELLDGESEPGFFLPRPRNLLRRGSATLFDGAVAPGTYRVAVGVARTEVLSDPNDEWSEYSRQSYATSIVPAAVNEPEGLSDNDSRPVCDISPGEVCIVTARVIRSRAAPADSAGGYAVEFGTRIAAAQP